MVKHNGPLLAPGERDKLRPSLPPSTRAGRWAQRVRRHRAVAAIADDIAYNNHDIDDALRAGLLEIDALREVDLVGEVLVEVDRLHPGLDNGRRIQELVRRMIGAMVGDLLAESRRRLADNAVAAPAEVRAAAAPMVAFSAAMQKRNLVLKAFLFDNVYRTIRSIA